MKKPVLFLSLLFIAGAMNAQTQCNPTLQFTNTTVVSSNMMMDTTNSAAAFGNVLVCGGTTLTYNSWLGKDFYLRTGATLVLKAAQITRINMEPGATLIFDTTGAVFNGTIIGGIAYDATNVTFVDTNQIYIDTAAVYWNNCPGNLFTYNLFPVAPCGPSSIAENNLSMAKLKFENPVRDFLRLEESVLEKTNQIRIIDMTGKVLRSIRKMPSIIEVASLPCGMYILELSNTKGERLIAKIVKD